VAFLAALVIISCLIFFLFIGRGSTNKQVSESMRDIEKVIVKDSLDKEFSEVVVGDEKFTF